jgi:hypothetical protein
MNIIGVTIRELRILVICSNFTTLQSYSTAIAIACNLTILCSKPHIAEQFVQISLCQGSIALLQPLFAINPTS